MSGVSLPFLGWVLKVQQSQVAELVDAKRGYMGYVIESVPSMKYTRYNHTGSNPVLTTKT